LLHRHFLRDEEMSLRCRVFISQEASIVRKLSLLTLFALSAALTACGGNDVEPKFSIAVIGDMPYGTTPDDTAQFAASGNFIKAINADAEASLVAHVGDIHSGSQYCTQDYNLSVFNLWKSFQDPLVYTPGDNEWTDCQKAKEGGGTYNAATGAIDYVRDAGGKLVNYAGGDPVDNLALVRSIFFATPGKTLGMAMDVHSQALEFDSAFPADKQYAENVWWEKSKVLFVTLNIPGGSNNDTDPWYGAPSMSDKQSQEVAARSAADLRWLDTAFKRAQSNGDTAVVILLQADMWDLDGKSASHIAQYKQFVDRIASNTKSFGKPVLLFNGDSHVYRSDNPLKSGAPCVTEAATGVQTTACTSDAYANQPNGYDVPNFHRITVHGSSSPLEWLKLAVDPAANAANGNDAFGPFSWARMRP
jgi:hypothetical protein